MRNPAVMALRTVATTAAISACGPSTHGLVGQARPPIFPDQIKIFSHPPATPFEEIAVLDAGSSSETKPDFALS